MSSLSTGGGGCNASLSLDEAQTTAITNALADLYEDGISGDVPPPPPLPIQP